MAVLLVTAAKGGVGKSTTVVGLAGVAFARGVDLLVVDTDPQAAALRHLGPDLVTHAPFPSEAAVRALDRPGRLVLVDTAPGLPVELAGAVAAADGVLGVCGPGWPDMATVPALERWTAVDAFVGCRFDLRRRLHREALGQYRARLGERWLAVVPARAEVELAAAQCRPFASGSDVAAAFVELWGGLRAVLGWEVLG